MIPKIIHYCWLSDDKYPDLVQRCIASWRRYLPDYTFVLWNKDKFDVKSTLWTKQSFESQKYAFTSDYIRLYALNKYGGIYLDTDVEVLKSFDAFLQEHSFSGYDYVHYLEAAIIGAEKSSKWLETCLNYYKKREFLLGNGICDIKPLPIIISDTLNLNSMSDKEIKKVYGLKIYPYEYLSPKNPYNGNIDKTKNTFAIHHFQGQWIKKGINYRLKSFFHLILLRLVGRNMHHLLQMKIRNLLMKIRS